MKRVALKILIVVLIAVLIGAGIWAGVYFLAPTDQSDGNYPVQLGSLTLKEKPQRICSLSPGVTDALRALGASGRVAFLSDYCSDEGTHGAKRVGSLYAPDFRVLSEQIPDLAVSLGEPSDAVLQRMNLLEIPFLVLQPADSLEGLKDNAEILAKAVYGVKAGAQKYQSYLADLNYQLKTCKAYAETQNISVLWLTGDGTKAFTEDTLGGSLLREAGFRNAAPGKEFAWDETQMPEGDYRILMIDEALWESFSPARKEQLKAGVDGTVFFPGSLIERQSPELTGLYEKLQLELNRLGAGKED